MVHMCDYTWTCSHWNAHTHTHTHAHTYTYTLTHIHHMSISLASPLCECDTDMLSQVEWAQVYFNVGNFRGQFYSILYVVVTQQCGEDSYNYTMYILYNWWSSVIYITIKSILVYRVILYSVTIWLTLTSKDHNHLHNWQSPRNLSPRPLHWMGLGGMAIAHSVTEWKWSKKVSWLNC